VIDVARFGDVTWNCTAAELGGDTAERFGVAG